MRKRREEKGEEKGRPGQEGRESKKPRQVKWSKGRSVGGWREEPRRERKSWRRERGESGEEEKV